MLDLPWFSTATADCRGAHAGLVPRQQEGTPARLDAVKREIDRTEVESKVAAGVTHVSIVRYARDNSIDLIVLATHRRTGVSHPLIGSVAE